MSVEKDEFREELRLLEQVRELDRKRYQNIILQKQNKDRRPERR